jgi:hypothetical protein
MRARTAFIAAIVLLAAGTGWYLFRPERLVVNQTVSESFPAVSAAPEQAPVATGPVELAAGRFQSVAHETTGRATIYQLPDGQRVLRLTEFHTSNGPDVQVYLVAAEDARDSASVTRAGFVNVGALKGNIGDQNYEVPVGVDLDKHRAVTVWCRRFSVNFGTAPLAPGRGRS